MTNKNRATLIGFSAILLWSSLVGTIRIVCENLGAYGGVAVIYSAASVILLLIFGLKTIHHIPKRYLFWGDYYLQAMSYVSPYLLVLQIMGDKQ